MGLSSGGICVNVGCIPTKTLVASARAAHVAPRGEEFGVAVNGPIQVDIMYASAPYTVIQRAVHIHPTVAELIPTLLGDLKPLE